MPPETTNRPEQKFEKQSEQIPVFASWNAWYGLVVGVFALVVGLLWWFSRVFS